MAKAQDYPTSEVRFDNGAVALLLLFVIGGYVDGWAHNHFDIIETFFTPWHAVLYGGFALSALYFIIPAWRNHRRGYDVAHVLPRGYLVSLLGALLFAVAGVCDMIWHILFGVEASVDALMSPPHIFLFTSGLLMFSGPVRSIVSRRDPDRRSWAANGALVIAMACYSLTLSFILQPWLSSGTADASALFGPHAPRWTQRVRDLEATGKPAPFIAGTADIGGLHGELSAPAAQATLKSENTKILPYYLQRIGVASIIIEATLLMGVLLYLVKLRRVPPGAFTVIVFLTVLGVSVMRELSLPPGFVLPQVAIGLITGVIADLLYGSWKPHAGSPRALYGFAFCVPAIFYALYFAAMAAFGGGSWWSGHMLLGSILYAGGIGILLATLVARNDAALAEA
jgi:hypothetical protein